jgi:AcrR family transcriptional regulator
MDDLVPAGRPAHQLPAGRHGIPHEIVVANQRGRLLEAVMRVVTTKGYAAMRVVDITDLAGVSRRTFYDNFTDKEDAFLTAYDTVVGQLTATVGAAFATGDVWPSKVAVGLSMFLNQLASAPAVAHVCIVEVMAAGPSALERRAQAMTRFRQFVIPSQAEVPKGNLVSPLTVETVIGGLYDVIYSRVVAGRTAELPSLMPDFLHAILLPFLGPEVAAAEYGRASDRVAAAGSNPAGRG